MLELCVVSRVSSGRVLVAFFSLISRIELIVSTINLLALNSRFIMHIVCASVALCLLLRLPAMSVRVCARARFASTRLIFSKMDSFLCTEFSHWNSRNSHGWARARPSTRSHRLLSAVRLFCFIHLVFFFRVSSIPIIVERHRAEEIWTDDGHGTQSAHSARTEKHRHVHWVGH